MIATAQSVVNEIDGYIKGGGGAYHSWYVGVANDARRRLFIDHNVNEQVDCWIYKKTDSDKTARAIEAYFIKQLGTDGGSGGGGSDSVYVYAYKKTQNTKQ